MTESTLDSWKAMQTRPLLLGHRGARAVKSIPENTLASFDFTLSTFCDGFEFDVRLTADGRTVLSHDATVHGLEIAKCPARKLGLPSLRDVMARYRRTAFLDIELKVPGLEKITADLLQTFPPARGYVVSSFIPDVLEKLSSVNPKIPLGLICERQRQLSGLVDVPAEYAILHHRLVRKELIENMRFDGKKIFVWTVNSPLQMKRFSRWGVDGIISDDPRVLSQVVRPELMFGKRSPRARSV
jgi:glycerophosphoryl diester phosphodiesterase